MFAYFRAPLTWRELLKRTVVETFDDGCPGLAAQLAFYFFLAVFPALLFFVSLLAYLPVEPALDTAIARLEAFMPREVLEFVREQIAQVMRGDRGGMITLAIAGAVWSSSAAMMAIITALNRAYDIEESRPFWKSRLLAIVMTVALAVFGVLAFALVVGGRELGLWVASLVGASDVFAQAWTLLQWPMALVLIVFVVDLVYYLAPNADTEWVWITPGSLLATALWLATSYGFKLYVRNFTDYTAVYGAIGAVIVLLLWLYLSGFALLVGAELNAEIDKALDQQGRAQQNGGPRKKVGPAAEKAALSAP